MYGAFAVEGFARGLIVEGEGRNNPPAGTLDELGCALLRCRAYYKSQKYLQCCGEAAIAERKQTRGVFTVGRLVQ